MPPPIMIAQTRAVNMASGGGGGGGSAAAGWPGAAAAGDSSLTADDAEYGTTLVEDVKVGWVGHMCALPLGGWCGITAVACPVAVFAAPVPLYHALQGPPVLCCGCGVAQHHPAVAIYNGAPMPMPPNP